MNTYDLPDMHCPIRTKASCRSRRLGEAVTTRPLNRPGGNGIAAFGKDDPATIQGRRGWAFSSIVPAVALLITVLVPARAFAADWRLDPNETPFHPTIITTEYEGKSYPITAAAGETAEIEVSGKLKKLGSSEHYQPRLSTGYAPGFIEFKTSTASTLTATRMYRFQGGGTVPGSTVDVNADYTCSLVSSTRQTGCYLAVIFFRTDAVGDPDDRTVAIGFKQIGDIPAGPVVQVKISRGYIPVSGGNYYCLPFIFTKGKEIRSDQCEFVARFFRAQEVASHSRILQRYQEQHPSADRQAVAYLRYPPVLPDGIDLRTLPPTINATFVVMETGEVNSLALDYGLDPLASQAIRRALNGWLFLPRLKAGVPSESLIRLPLSFGPSTTPSRNGT